MRPEAFPATSEQLIGTQKGVREARSLLKHEQEIPLETCLLAVACLYAVFFGGGIYCTTSPWASGEPAISTDCHDHGSSFSSLL